MDKYQALRQYFGYTAFRGGQEKLIDGILSGRDVFGIMPTGGGKSICYQIPALLLEGVTLVVSPLISLMKDQVMALKNAGVSAAYINSSLTAEQIRRVYANLWEGMYKIVYIAPERLLTDGFLSVAENLKIALLAVDEAHCISQWGQDFRPSYLKIVDFLNLLPNRPVVCAFTATATEQVREDIRQSLQLRAPLQIITGFDRPNLHYDVLRPKNKSEKLLSLVAERRNKSGIIYCSTRKDVESVCAALQEQGYSATRYHAGLSDQERRENQEDFVFDRSRIMVATNAFGMGIDKSNVSYVIHYNMPKSLEAYYQEAGRAGRDGENAECVLMYSAGDVRTARFLIQNSAENDERSEEERAVSVAQDLARLEVMTGYCKTEDCLRGYILDYFGEAHEPCCGSCGNCGGETVLADITRQAQMILSCVRRIQDKLGYAVGAVLVVRTLSGSRDKRILELGLDHVSTYGLMKKVPRSEIRQLIDVLETRGYLRTDATYSTLNLTAKAGDVLFRGETVTLRQRVTPEERPAPRPATVFGAPDEDLLDALKKVRWRLAKQENVPLYVIFSNATLSDMAAKAPRNEEEFMTVSGVGYKKCSKYSEAFLEAIREFRGA